jgi:ubiquinol-cytochrome c reductase cytochrome b subunit
MLGLVIYLLMMATAFLGYVLPWGQMSYWGAQVITGFFSAFPLVGEPIRVWLLGGYAPDQAALTRFFSLHYLLPFVIAAVVVLHIWALHIPGSGNPTGVDVKNEKDTLPFHPFYTAKDGWFTGAILVAYTAVLFFAPNALGHPDNYIQANPLATPAHIVPEWYFWPFYAILRAFTVDFLWIIPAKLWGVLAMFFSILLLFFLPWLDKSPVRSGHYRPVFKRFFWLLMLDILVLGYVGGAEINAFNIALGQFASAYYFIHFLIILPLVSAFEKPLPLPNSISESVLHGEKQEAAPIGAPARAGATAAE